MFRSDKSDAMRTSNSLQQLRDVIRDYGQMAHRLYSYQSVRIEVDDLAFRLRETSQNIVAALGQLEKEGWAGRTKYKGVWTLRVQRANPSNEVLDKHENRRRTQP
jgi:hypothetical protein